ncbi:F-box only 6-like [Chlorella sorokiniana]|uniref:F-box only 6-like n=1 Tax=Chlorella sorokiniana TaxID=3076 RepID=A0A2P6TFB7_CHLSO|nr:F-box only 6-like [Chlorella sorokiniana]|eukprot:PRW32666.1 F-box only 6-like [Chlorella sorokiniana]
MAAEQGASWSELPLDSLTDVLSRLPAKDLAACASVCTAWRAAADQQALWSLQRQQDFPQADDATLAVLLARAGSSSSDSSSSSGSSSRRAQRRSAAKLAYWWLAREWTCERCQQRFTDGANSPSACCFHTGILFSGGLMNGEALRYTCCNRRAHQIANGVRDSNGCTSAFHCGGRSAWQRHGTGVKPRELPPEPAAGPTSSSPRHNNSDASSSSGLGKVRSSSRLVSSAAPGGNKGGSGCGSPWGSLPGSPARPSPDPQEWHPNQRPGLLELPSRLFASGSGSAA